MFDSVYSFARGLHQFHKNVQYSSTSGTSAVSSLSNQSSSQMDLTLMDLAPYPPMVAPYSPYYASSLQIPSPPTSSNFAQASSSQALTSHASCSNETPWINGLSLYNYIDSVRFRYNDSCLPFSNSELLILKLFLFCLFLFWVAGHAIDELGPRNSFSSRA